MVIMEDVEPPFLYPFDLYHVVMTVRAFLDNITDPDNVVVRGVTPIHI